MKYLVFILILYLKYVSSSFCYWNSGCPYKYFSDKTPYNNVRGDIRDSLVKLKGCQPISIWSLLGTPKTTAQIDYLTILNESLSIRENVISSYKSGKSSLCAQDFENLQNWKADNKMLSKINFLTEEGAQDILGIANRLQQSFPNLIRDHKDGNHKISSTEGLMEESAQIFVKGFYKRLSIEKTKDNIIPYAKCKKYQDLLKDPSFYKEVRKYEKTSDFFATKDRMQRRLGIDGLSDSAIKSLYDLCRFPWSGIENKFSPWCALFTTEDLRVLEYVGDLEHYYKSGYGTPINAHLGRIPLADLFKTFQAAKNGAVLPIVTYFSDSSTLDMVCTALNLFKDEIPLSGAKRNSKRKWRTSKLSVFSANLVVVLNRIRSGHYPSRKFGYLMKKVESPYCEVCGSLDDVHHLLMDCAKNRTERESLMQKLNLNRLDIGTFVSILAEPTTEAANLLAGAFMHRCDKDGEADYNVVFYLNEEPLLPICERGFCSWEELEDKLSPFLNTTMNVCS